MTKKHTVIQFCSQNQRKEQSMVFWTFPKTRIIGLHWFVWKCETSYTFLLAQTEIKIILGNNFGHLGREHQGLKKPCNPHTPKVQGRVSFHTATSLWQLQISMLYRNALNTDFNYHSECRLQNPGSKIQFSSLSFKTQWNLECKPQLETRKARLFYLTSYKWRLKLSFAVRPWNRSFELPWEFPPPLE